MGRSSARHRELPVFIEHGRTCLPKRGAESKARQLLPAGQRQEGRWLGRAAGTVTQV